ncbi:MAG: hypothetical protein MJZ41_00875 [Bacteroidaceae bacterium]|nr:hypothetical protein [Bacteroidaceae bacterium]
MELFNKMKSRSCFKGCLFAPLAIIIISGLIYLLLLLYGKYHTFNRTLVADIKSVGYEIVFTEVEHDSILAFGFKRKDDNKNVSTLFVYNSSWDVISFIFTKDTIYIRDEMEFQDLFPPEERDKHPKAPKDWVKRRIIKGDLPSSVKIIPYSDSLIFVYDTNKHKYVLKDSTMHIFNLAHNVERANEYYLFDESLKDTLEIHLKECAKQ